MRPAAVSVVDSPLGELGLTRDRGGEVALWITLATQSITDEDMMKLKWVKPKVVVEGAFVEWTRDGFLRHPKFVGIRDDKKARDVIRELAIEEV